MYTLKLLPGGGRLLMMVDKWQDLGFGDGVDIFILRVLIGYWPGNGNFGPYLGRNHTCIIRKSSAILIFDLLLNLYLGIFKFRLTAWTV